MSATVGGTLGLTHAAANVLQNLLHRLTLQRTEKTVPMQKLGKGMCATSGDCSACECFSHLADIQVKLHHMMLWRSNKVTQAGALLSME